MNADQSITWLPASICEDVTVELDQVLSNWASTWGLPTPTAAQSELIHAKHNSVEPFVDLLGAPPPGWKQALCQSLFKVDVYGSPLVEAVLSRVIASLQIPLREAFGAVRSSPEPQGPLGHAGVRIVVDLVGERSGLMLTCAQLRASGKLKPPVPEALARVAFEKALADVAVPLVAELGQAEVSVEEILQLTVDDVLLLDARIDAPLHVVSPASSLRLPAHLGMSSSPPRRAVRWLPTPPDSPLQ